MRAETPQSGSEESGQVLVIAAIGMTMMLVMVALVVDIGKAMLVQRQLQAGVDAAALAGAQHLPDPTEATQAAQEYGPTPGSQERGQHRRTGDDDGDDALRPVGSRVLDVASTPYNGLSVRATSNVPTLFARILGIDKLTVNATATACSPCSVKPLDIMVVLDRTGSMCQFSTGANDPNCTDLNNAKDGIRTFLGFLDPASTRSGSRSSRRRSTSSYVCARAPYKPWSGRQPRPAPDGPRRQVLRLRRLVARVRHDGSRGSDAGRVSTRSGRLVVCDYLVEERAPQLDPQPSQSALVQRLGSSPAPARRATRSRSRRRSTSSSGTAAATSRTSSSSSRTARRTRRRRSSRPSYWTNNPTQSRHPCGAGVQSAANAKGEGHDRLHDRLRPRTAGNGLRAVPAA